MEITIAAVGRMKSGPIKVLWDDYAKRITWPIRLREVEEKRRLAAAQLKAREGELLRQALPDSAFVIALDAAGKTLDSQAFAKRVEGWLEQSGGHIAFIIGGADGLDPPFRAQSAYALSLGAMTWPHMLARIMLLEQIYRAQTILTNHPYHR